MMPISQQIFGQLSDGTSIDLYTLTNDNGMEVKITNYGATVTSIKVPDKEGLSSQVILGFDDLDGYLQEQPFIGCVVGRYANRIAAGRFTVDGNTYTLATNNPPNHLHGGIKNFGQVPWTTTTAITKRSASVTLQYLSVDGEEGFPGTVDCTVIYTLTDNNSLEIHYKASTDKPTVINLTNHCYFNLKDGGRSSVQDHELKLFAERFTPVDATCIPLGTIQSVKRTPFNFLTWQKIGKRINKKHKQLQIGNGYDHNFVINKGEHDLKIAAKLVDRVSGRLMTVSTTEPGIQLYTANWLDGSLKGHQGTAYNKRCAVCLETQHFPDSPNQTSFPSTLLLPETPFTSKTIYKFSVK